MSGNTFGRIFTLTTFGESHGPALGGIVDGCPGGIALDQTQIQHELDARKPGNDGQGGVASTSRKEADQVQILSGVFEGKTTGAPIAFLIQNTSQKSQDYEKLRHLFRPGHADYTWQQKFGHRDHTGGGRMSARETAARVAGGAIALALLAEQGISLRAFTLEFAGICAKIEDSEGAKARPFFCPNNHTYLSWQQKAIETKENGDSLGGIVQIEAYNLPPGLGEPVFDGLDARLAYALFSVGAVKGVEVGAGFAAASLPGSINNDIMTAQGFLSNNAGGILGGMSSGQPLCLKVAVKPIPSIGKAQQLLDNKGNTHSMSIGGRHDISPIPRIVPVLKAMTALCLADFVLLQRRNMKK